MKSKKQKMFGMMPEEKMTEPFETPKKPSRKKPIDYKAAAPKVVTEKMKKKNAPMRAQKRGF